MQYSMSLFNLVNLKSFQKALIGWKKTVLQISHLELFENFSNCFDWLDKTRSFKKATYVLIFMT